MNNGNTWAKVAVAPLTLTSVLLLFVFSIGRADTMGQFYTGIFTTWAILATTCAFTAYSWFRLIAPRRIARWPTLVVWLLVGSSYTAMEISVMRQRQKTAEDNMRRRQQMVEPAGGVYDSIER